MTSVLKPAAAMCGMLLCAPVQAQTADRSADKSALPATTITITTKKQKVTKKIDRPVYDQTSNPTSQSGTAADVLKTVPSVSVTPDGEVSLRGDRMR